MMVYEKITEIIAVQFNVEEDSLNKDTSFRDDLNADSLDLVELIMAIEDEFDLEVDDEGMEDIETIGDVVESIEKELDKVEDKKEEENK